MKFQPQSEDEVLNLWPTDEYDYEVMEAEDTVSKAGDQQIKLKLMLINHLGGSKHLNTWLNPKMMYLVKHFAESCGIEAMYESGGYDASDCLKKRGRCKVGKQEAVDEYQAKNVVTDYVKRDSSLTAAEEEFKDEIPF